MANNRIELNDDERTARLERANQTPHETCVTPGPNCFGSLMSMPGGRTMCDYHRKAHYTIMSK